MIHIVWGWEKSPLKVPIQGSQKSFPRDPKFICGSYICLWHSYFMMSSLRWGPQWLLLFKFKMMISKLWYQGRPVLWCSDVFWICCLVLTSDSTLGFQLLTHSFSPSISLSTVWFKLERRHQPTSRQATLSKAAGGTHVGEHLHGVPHFLNICSK